MANVIDTILSEALTMAIAEAETYKPQILAAAAAANVTLESAIDTFIASIKVSGALGLVIPALKSALTSAVNGAINSGAMTEETALFNLIVAAAQNEAKKLAAAA